MFQVVASDLIWNQHDAAMNKKKLYVYKILLLHLLWNYFSRQANSICLTSKQLDSTYKSKVINLQLNFGILHDI